MVLGCHCWFLWPGLAELNITHIRSWAAPLDTACVWGGQPWASLLRFLPDYHVLGWWHRSHRLLLPSWFLLVFCQREAPGPMLPTLEKWETPTLVLPGLSSPELYKPLKNLTLCFCLNSDTQWWHNTAEACKSRIVQKRKTESRLGN